MEKIDDPRFSFISKDPRFKKTPKSIRKVKIDKRFLSLFTDKSFQVKYSVDRRGRPVDHSSHENFMKYYELSSDDNEESGEEEDTIANETQKESRDKSHFSKQNNTPKSEKLKKNEWVVTLSNELPVQNKASLEVINNKKIKSHEKVNNAYVINNTDTIEKSRITDDIKTKLRDPVIDYARGMGMLISDSSSEEESGDSESENEAVEHGWGELDRDAETTEEVSDRLAVLHMDWDRIRAVDLMVLFNSFLPPGGVIKSICIYPSQFGLERMKMEEERGPTELVNTNVNQVKDNIEESKDGKQYHMERLRQYQLNRLKYYYAIIHFDSAETANKVYTECDGLEYESSATKLDLRFVPEEETFDQEAHEICTSMPDPAKYEPRVFTNTALQQGKVELTWDETDPSRQEFTRKIQKNADNIENADLQAYLASSSGEEDDEDEKLVNYGTTFENGSESEEEVNEENKIEKYKLLLASVEEEEEKKKNRDVDLEITWGVGLKEKAGELVKEKLKTPQTPFEQMLDKRRQNKKLKKEEKRKQKEKEGISSDDSDDDIPSDVDMDDPFFKEELQGSKSRKKNSIPNEREFEEARQKAAELDLLLLEENDIEKQKNHFNLKGIQDQESTVKKSRKRRKQLKKRPQEVMENKEDFQVNLTDDRFGALFTSHHFNIDPADSQFRKTKGMEDIISEKLKRRRGKLESFESSVSQATSSPELSLLVKSIKKKMKNNSKNK